MHLRRARDPRFVRPLLVADLAIPRDVDPRLSDEMGVTLKDIDDLQDLVQHRHPLAGEVQRAAEAIVEVELTDYRSWCEARRYAPVIRALRAKADDILQVELGRTVRRLGDITPTQQRCVHAMGQAIINKLLHEPILCIKEPPDELSSSETYELIQALFGITDIESRKSVS
jgi:glutamyl-tRNA reductase